MEVSEFKYISLGGGARETLFTASIDPATADPRLQINSSTLERVLICNTDSEDITIRLQLDDGTDTYPALGTRNTGETVGFLGGFDLLLNKYNFFCRKRIKRNL